MAEKSRRLNSGKELQKLLWSVELARAELALVKLAIPTEHRWLVEFIGISGRTCAEACRLSVQRTFEDHTSQSDTRVLPHWVAPLNYAEEAFLDRYIVELRLPIIRRSSIRSDGDPSAMFLDVDGNPISVQSLSNLFRRVGRRLGLSMCTTPNSVRSQWLRSRLDDLLEGDQGLVIVHAGHCVREPPADRAPSGQSDTDDWSTHDPSRCLPCAYKLSSSDKPPHLAR